MKQLVKAYLLFTQKERRGIIFLLVIIAIINLLPWLLSYFQHPRTFAATGFEKELAMLQIDSAKSKASKAYKPYDLKYSDRYETDSENTQGELFYFDPNTATADDWKRLGLREKTIQTIMKYTSKGGRFYKPEDIGKIWGLHPNQVERLMPYVRIDESQNTIYTAKEFRPYKKESPTPVVLDVNRADTTAFIALPGIGSKLALRIVNFREKLGGFYRLDQVAETWGLPDSTWQKIKNKLVLEDPNIKKININKTTLEELRGHPYLKYAVANAIIQYRNQHGPYQTVEEIRKIALVDEALFSKISPYLRVE